MRVYIAAPWVDRDHMPRIAMELEACGFEITRKWWQCEYATSTQPSASLLCEYAGEDARGVLSADVLLLINSTKSEGKAVEQGLALAKGIPIVAVGVRGEQSKNIFHYLEQYRWVDTVPEAIARLHVLRLSSLSTY